MSNVILAMSGMAMGLTLTEKDITGYVHVEGDTYADWNTNFTITALQNGDFTFSDALIGSTTTIKENNNDTTRTVTTVAITLDASKLATVTSNSALLTLNGTADTGIGFTTDRKASTMWITDSNTNYTYFSVNSVLPTTGDITLTFSFSHSGTTLYVGNTYDTHSNLKGNIGSVASMTLSAYAVGALKSITTYAGVASLRDTDLSSSAASLNANKAIPEPTTATLSLLALAGLAARRRRR